MLAYIDARAVMDRLDDTVGPLQWRDSYREGAAGGLICRIELCSWRDGEPVWVGKEDGAENTKVEAVKGGMSDAFKRAAVKWGIGRYLYSLPAEYHDIREGWANGKGVDVSASGKHVGWIPYPELKPWALPSKPKETPAEKRARQALHDPDWPGDRGWFFAEIRQYLWDHDSLWAECDKPDGIFKTTKPYPSAWGTTGRRWFVDELGHARMPLGPLEPKEKK